MSRNSLRMACRILANPDDVIAIIFSFLNLDEKLFDIPLVCRTFARCAKSPHGLASMPLVVRDSSYRQQKSHCSSNCQQQKLFVF